MLPKRFVPARWRAAQAPGLCIALVLVMLSLVMGPLGPSQVDASGASDPGAGIAALSGMDALIAGPSMGVRSPLLPKSPAYGQQAGASILFLQAGHRMASAVWRSAPGAGPAPQSLPLLC